MLSTVLSHSVCSAKQVSFRDSEWSVTNFNDDIDRGRTDISGGRLHILRSRAGGNGGSQGAVAKVDIPIRGGHARLQFDAKADYRSVRGGNGDHGTENPIAVRLVMKDDRGRDLLFILAANYEGAVENKDYVSGDVHTIQRAIDVHRGKWTHLSVNIFDYFPDADVIREVQVLGSGWDFEGSVDNLRILTDTPKEAVPPLAHRSGHRHDVSDFRWSVTNFNDDIDRGRTDISGGRLHILRSRAGGNGGSQGAVAKVDIPIRGGHARLQFDAKADYRSVRRGNGDHGTENPIAVRLVMKDERGRDLLFILAANYGGAVENKDYSSGGVHTIQRAIDVNQGRWTHLSVNISDYFPEADVIREVQVLGSGWDFEGSVDNLRIVSD